MLYSNFGNGTWENSKCQLCCGWPTEKNSPGHGERGLFCEVLFHWHWELLLSRNHKHFNLPGKPWVKTKSWLFLTAKKKISSTAGSNWFLFLFTLSKCTLRLLDWSGSDGLSYSGRDTQIFFSWSWISMQNVFLLYRVGHRNRDCIPGKSKNFE